MFTCDFDFDLPPHLIAQEPSLNKANTKMLVFKQQQIADATVKDLVNFLPQGCVLVFNDAKVIKAKLTAIIARNQAVLNFNLNQQISNDFQQNSCWTALAKPLKKVQVGDLLQIGENFSATVLAKNGSFLTLSFSCNNIDLLKNLEKFGQMPLPPYIKTTSEKDHQNYQTIYAKNGMAVAAPTAGLHFNQEILDSLKQKEITQTFLTLNVGAGTFLPVKTTQIADHQMHHESFVLNQETADIINLAKKEGRKIIAVGTTALRVLEAVANQQGKLLAKTGSTDIFIYPPYQFKIVDGLFTNFHLPKSTLFMLISAFVGKKNAFIIYNHAIKHNYRFYSYGDSSLLI
jgi:S-adenosylmethionine:tRNA ribosyltransferase-isomerase